MPPPEPVDLAAAEDVAATFAEAHRTGRSLVLATSGTSSTPRRIVRTTASWADSFDAVSRLSGIDATSRVWVPGPRSATMTLFALAHAAAVGAAVVANLGEATHAHLTPARLAHLVATRPAELAGVTVITAGDRLERRAHDAAVAAGARVHHYFGAAEFSFVAWGSHAEDLHVFPGVEVVVRKGEIWVRSPFLAQAPAPGEPTAVRMDALGWRTVGDRGTLVGDHLTVTGRSGAITTAGATVLISDVEHELRAVCAGPLIVVGVPHPDLGQIITAVVTCEADLAAAKVRARDALPATHRPRRWFVIESLPLTPHGKVDRAAVEAAVSTRYHKS